MKRLLSVVLALALLLTCAPAIPLTANAATSGYYTYTVFNGKATITDCNESISGDITIPATLGGYPVTSIVTYAFSDCSSLTSVVIPDSVTYIGDDAFYNCSSLESVVIGDSVTSIGRSAFSYCSSLTGIWVDADNTAYCSDEQGVLYNKDKTTLIQAPAKGIAGTYTIPDSVTSISDYAFYSCDSLTSIEIPDSVTSIGDDAFRGCNSLTSVVIGDSVTSIGDWAFSYCSSLTSVVIGDSVISIGTYAFSDCRSLRHVAYTGTQSRWSSISIDRYNTDLTNATRHYETSFEMIDNCVEAGVYCPVCKEFIVRTERGNHQETPVPGYAPTCTEPGLTDGSVCTLCGEVVTQQVEIPAIGHDIIDGVCQNCDYGKNVVILEGDGETFYSTVENALAAATGGTIKLLTDMQAGTLVLPSGVKLDLNGYTLTARYLVVAKGAEILDSGALKIAKDNLIYAQEDGNGIIPVWNGDDGYVFTKVVFQEMARPLGNGAAQYIFLPSFSNAEAAALLADGGADNDLKMKVGLTWNNGQCQQFYTYGDDLVEQVFASGGRLVFSLTVTGISSITDMTAQAVVVTDSGAQATNVSIPVVAG